MFKVDDVLRMFLEWATEQVREHHDVGESDGHATARERMPHVERIT